MSIEHACQQSDKAYLSFFSKSAYQMVDVSQKSVTQRTAIAVGQIKVGEKACNLIRLRQLPKGDPLALAEIAGINGAKHAYQQIPLCHPLALDRINIKVECDDKETVTVYCLAAAQAKTGVEMEALAGVQAALLSIYDLTKMIEPALTITETRLLLKEGGKHGRWLHPDGVPETILQSLTHHSTPSVLAGIKAAVVTISDRASNGQYDDISGGELKNTLKQLGAEIVDYTVIPDNNETIKTHVKAILHDYAPQLIISTGGTGISPKDMTYQTFNELCDEEIPGVAELLRQDGAKYTKYSWLSRSFAGKLRNALLIALPGNPKSIGQAMSVLQELLPHALQVIAGEGHA